MFHDVLFVHSYTLFASIVCVCTACVCQELDAGMTLVARVLRLQRWSENIGGKRVPLQDGSRELAFEADFTTLEDVFEIPELCSMFQ